MSPSMSYALLVAIAIWMGVTASKALGCMKTGRPMVLSFLQGGAMSMGKVLTGRSVAIYFYVHVAGIASLGLWMIPLDPYWIGPAVTVALSIVSTVITLSAKKPSLVEAEPEMPAATVVKSPPKGS